MSRGGESPLWAPGQREPQGDDKGVSGRTEHPKAVVANLRNTAQANPKAVRTAARTTVLANGKTAIWARGTVARGGFVGTRQRGRREARHRPSARQEVARQRAKRGVHDGGGPSARRGGSSVRPKTRAGRGRPGRKPGGSEAVWGVRWSHRTEEAPSDETWATAWRRKPVRRMPRRWTSVRLGRTGHGLSQAGRGPRGWKAVRRPTPAFAQGTGM